MLRLLSGWKLLSSGSLHLPSSPSSLRTLPRLGPLPRAAMYTTRLYSSAGAGGGGGPAGGKPARRTQLSAGGGGAMTMMENHHHHHHHHPSAQSPAYPLYQGRAEPHRGPHFHGHHPPHHYHPHPHHAPPPAHLAPPTHLAPPLVPPPHLHHFQQQHAHLHHHHYSHGPALGGGGGLASGRKKTWNFIQEKMSYDTFFTLKRLIERSHRPDEVLRWVTQNPGKISHNHYPIALHKISQLLQGGGGGGPAAGTGSSTASDGGGAPAGAASCPPGAGGAEESEGRDILEQQDFQTLCDDIIGDCAKFDNFSVVNCLYAVAALGLPSDCRVVEVLEAECQARLGQFNQKDVSMVFSSSMKLHLGRQHPLTEACLAALEKNLERERHPQTLFLLLSYYRLKLRTLQPPEGANGPAASSPELLLANRKILRLVKHTLASVSGVREQEMALLDEMLAACVREASNKSLELIFSSHLFYQNRQERFIASLAKELPKKVDSITPYTMALIAKYVARHRLRETQLLDTIADFLVKKAEYLDSKVIQKLVFPFSRMSYRPANEQQLFSKLEVVLELKALSSPLATVNILMSLFQLGHFPSLVLHRVFSPSFISNVTNSPYALIVRRYLSLLDATVQLEYRDYTGPRLQDAHKVLMFDHALTADEVNRKYSYKGLVAEALRQLVGEQSYKQDEVLAPGYYTDFLILMDASGRILPVRPGAGVPPPACVAVATPKADGAVSMTTLTSDFQKFSPFSPLKGEGPDPEGAVPEAFLPLHLRGSPGPNGAGGLAEYGSYYASGPDYYSGLAKDASLESQDSSTLSSPPSDSLAPPPPPGAPGPDSLFQFSIGQILEEEESGGVAAPPSGQEADCELQGFYEGVAYSESSASEGPATAPLSGGHPAERSDADVAAGDLRAIRRVVMSVNDKWHYCHNSVVLVGSRAMRDRHLQLLGYIILQLPYQELEKLNGIEEVKQYLHKKLLSVPL
ncbi:fas-activated serine/threonine kinase [Gadus macrocephalus]|uniref:fas-activated serine/threonine kinase n=1 Tax=Gadus macrocephalus TaxID=80720 RepID=UPI0028CB5BC9|nr:fas-activated serine/threonine kinase [Gadus macrocephalus]XP_059915123.1 fas-activated serine/threonine kinase [Gadus macrocephalus]